MAKAELTTVENFKIVTGMEAMDEELRAELEDELDDLDDDGGIDAKHIKIPSGGGKAFEVETDDPDDPEVMKEVTGVIIFTHRMNAYWAQKFGEAGLQLHGWKAGRQQRNRRNPHLRHLPL